MSTSSSERCTRISPSAVLDDRLEGKDLDWARDHLLRCESCRDRVEDFREMMVRVGRLPSAPIGALAMDEAYAASIPAEVRAGAASRRRFEMQSLPIDAAIAPALDLPPQPVRPEVTNVRDMLSDLEREIFRDEPVQDHPTALTPAGAAPARIEPHTADAAEAERPAEIEAIVPAPPVPTFAGSELRTVDLDSRQAGPQPAARLEDIQAEELTPPLTEKTPPPLAEKAPPPASSAHPDTVMRLAVGLGAAACVLLAAFLYEGGLLPRAAHKTRAALPTVSARAFTAASAPPSTTAAPTTPSAPVLFRLGDGVAGGTVYRIRPGTAVAGYTRLVFDIHGHGLPMMVITQPDPLHIAITFSGATGSALPVRGIRSRQVAAVEPAVQQGPDLVVTVDLARPDRITAFTLPAAGAYPFRLVVDLHTQ